jgi:hypothetical protein
MTSGQTLGLLSTAGTLLAAYGFYYTRVGDDLGAALSLSRPSDPDNRREAWYLSRRVLLRAAVPLTVGALVVLLVLFGGAWTAVREARFLPTRLSGPEAGLFLLTLFWLGLFLYFGWVSIRLASRLDWKR